jgi:hypothetical protein
MVDLGGKHLATRVLPKAVKKGWSSLMRRFYQPTELNNEVVRQAAQEMVKLQQKMSRDGSLGVGETPNKAQTTAHFIQSLYLSEEQAEKVYNHIMLREDL